MVCLVNDCTVNNSRIVMSKTNAVRLEISERGGVRDREGGSMYIDICACMCTCAERVNPYTCACQI